MVQDKRNLHLRFQEYCDCFLETDPKRELESIKKEGKWAEGTDAGHEEVALKFLALAILYGIRENARKVSVIKKETGEVQFNVEAAGKYRLPAPSPVIGDHIFQVMRAITHVDSDNDKQKLALGLRNDSLELEVGFSTTGDRRTLDIVFS